MVGHRRVAVLAAAFLIAFMLPALAPPGVARAAEPDSTISAASSPYSISGSVVGAYGGSLAGGTVTACSAPWSCTSATIGWDGSYWIGGIDVGSYIVSITPPTWTYPSGYYADWAAGNFTTDASSATPVVVWFTNVVLPTIVVPEYFPPPPTWGSISGYVVGAYSGSLAGGTVTACSASWSCASSAIGYDGWYWIGALGAGSYIVSITPPAYSLYPAGYYAAWAAGNFTTSASSATAVSVWYSNVALPTIVVPGYYPTYGSISGYVVGSYSGSMAGGTVTACDSVYWSCTSATIGWDGWYSIGALAPGSYRVSIAPPYASPYWLGYYASWAAGNFTTDASSATWVSVWNANVTLPTIVVPCSSYYPYTCPGTAPPVATVPPNVGGVVTGPPQKVVVTTFIRRADSSATTTTVRVKKGARVELAALIDPNLAGVRVEVWRQLPGQSWVMITTRGISDDGWVRYRFTASRAALYRFHVPGSSMTEAVWGAPRKVRML